MSFYILPLKIAKKFNRESKIYALQLYGTSSIIQVIISNTVISILDGFAEEIAYRGFLYGLFENLLGPLPAIVLSSILYGVAYSGGTFSSNGFLKFCLGMVYTVSLWLSGFNMLVPILLHILYEGSTTFATWLLASRELTERIKEEERIIEETYTTTTGQGSGETVTREITSEEKDEAAIHALFTIIDFDKSGVIDSDEWSLGLRLLG